MDNQIRLIHFTVNEEFEAKNVTEIPKGVSMIKAPEFWEKGNKGKGIKIAVIDTGCDINHPDLKDRIIGGKNFTTDDNGNPNIFTDYSGHGTHVAGTIAATENGKGVIGVAPQASLLILKALAGKNGEGPYEWIINAINYAIEKKVHIISMSLGGPQDVKELHDAIKKAVKNNILVVCAAGNESEGDTSGVIDEIGYPACYNEVISVGAIDYTRNTTIFTNSNKELDLVAPGVNILSTYPNNKLANLTGTSMAAPHVSGALALIINWAKIEFGRELSEVELYAQLIKRTVSLNYKKTIVGNGLIYLIASEILEDIIKKQTIN
ncbi:MAG: S8 family peptidase [Clostridium sp.]